jgi:hypothetical protein
MSVYAWVAVVLFSDLVDSTALLASLGDNRRTLKMFRGERR